jgi:LysR family transcriptional regulator, glycine cleavage system transcriptional activator
MSRRLPQLTALRAFEAAARHLSFARAAEELHVTPAAVSQQIKQLESYLGISLFRRGRRLILSDAAREALPLLSDGFDQLERAVSRLRAGYEDGPLVVSVPPTFAARWLVARLDDFQSAYPNIELHLHASRRLVDFTVEEVDVAVRFGSDPYPDLHTDRLMVETIVPVASPSLAATITAPAELTGYTLLNDDARAWDPTFPDWDTWLSSLGVTGKLRIRRFSDSNLVIEAATAGLGVALMWHSLVADELRAGRLQRLFDSILPTAHGYHLVVPPNRLQVPKIAAFRDWMLKQAQEQIAPE